MSLNRYTRAISQLCTRCNEFRSLSRQLSTNASQEKKDGAMKHIIFGANTDVGKTVITAGLIKACSVNGSGCIQSHYVKPLQCGGSDQGFVERTVGSLTSAATLFDWDTAASPHVASRLENKPVSDHEVIRALSHHLEEIIPQYHSEETPDPIWIETAGGVLSPSSSSPDNDGPDHATDSNGWGWQCQADLYSVFRHDMNVILVGDGRLGGISATLSSLESLLFRGYNVTGLILIESGHNNQEALIEYARRGDPYLFEASPTLSTHAEKAIISLPALPDEPEPLTDWYNSQEVSSTLRSFVNEHLASVSTKESS